MSVKVLARTMQRAFACAVAAALCALQSLLASAAERLTQGEEVVTGAGIGRVALGFILVAGLAVAVVVGLKRYLLRFGGVSAGGNQLRMLARIAPGGTLRLHLVEVESEKVLVAESRNGVALVVLPAGRQTQPPQP